MKLLKKYEDRLSELTTQKTVIEKEIQWVEELIESLKKEAYKTIKATEVRQEAESDEFTNLETMEAAVRILYEAFPKEVHQKDIAREMFRRGWQSKSKTPEYTVGNTLLRLCEKKVVEKTGRGTFRLKKRHKEGGIKEHETVEGEIPL